MKSEHKDLSPTELALLTWYKPDNLLYRNPEHPTIKLAGEIGELLDLYGKHKYKPGFDWVACKRCNHPKEEHTEKLSSEFFSALYPDKYACSNYTSLVLDELGDIYYYLRILAWIYGCEFPETKGTYGIQTLDSIRIMYFHASFILNHIESNLQIEWRLQKIYYCILGILENLDTTIEELTLLNYYKLNSEETNHGWKDAR